MTSSGISGIIVGGSNTQYSNGVNSDCAPTGVKSGQISKQNFYQHAIGEKEKFIAVGKDCNKTSDKQQYLEQEKKQPIIEEPIYNEQSYNYQRYTQTVFGEQECCPEEAYEEDASLYALDANNDKGYNAAFILDRRPFSPPFKN